MTGNRGILPVCCSLVPVSSAVTCRSEPLLYPIVRAGNQVAGWRRSISQKTLPADQSNQLGRRGQRVEIVKKVRCTTC